MILSSVRLTATFCAPVFIQSMNGHPFRDLRGNHSRRR
jgi:hypothetical protein